MIGARSRWALSFADLCLLLLGFFVLLQAHGRDPRVAESLRETFGEAAPPQATRFAADRLFERGEAVLLPAAKARIASLAASGGPVLVESRGTGGGSSRLDAWELSAARVGAVARALREAGLAEADIRIVMPPVEGNAGRGQEISLSPLLRHPDESRDPRTAMSPRS